MLVAAKFVDELLGETLVPTYHLDIPAPIFILEGLQNILSFDSHVLQSTYGAIDQLNLSRG